MAEKEEKEASSYLSSIPGTSQVSDAASAGAGKAQQGLGAAGYVVSLISLLSSPLLCSLRRPLRSS